MYVASINAKINMHVGVGMMQQLQDDDNSHVGEGNRPSWHMQQPQKSMDSPVAGNHLHSPLVAAIKIIPNSKESTLLQVNRPQQRVLNPTRKS